MSDFECARSPCDRARLRLLRPGSCAEQRAESLCICSTSHPITSTSPTVWTWYHLSRSHCSVLAHDESGQLLNINRRRFSSLFWKKEDCRYWLLVERGSPEWQTLFAKLGGNWDSHLVNQWIGSATWVRTWASKKMVAKRWWIRVIIWSMPSSLERKAWKEWARKSCYISPHRPCRTIVEKDETM